MEAKVSYIFFAIALALFIVGSILAAVSANSDTNKCNNQIAGAALLPLALTFGVIGYFMNEKASTFKLQ